MICYNKCVISKYWYLEIAIWFFSRRKNWNVILFLDCLLLFFEQRSLVCTNFNITGKKFHAFIVGEMNCPSAVCWKQNRGRHGVSSWIPYRLLYLNEKPTPPSVSIGGGSVSLLTRCEQEIPHVFMWEMSCLILVLGIK